MKYCIKCGKELPDDAAFCLVCGAPVPDSTSGESAGTTTSGEKKGQSGIGFKTELKPGIGYGTDLESLPEGFVLDGRYEIKEKVGHGGFGAVYRAYDRKMDIDKALKVLPRAVAEDRESLETLLVEARTMAKLNHPNIVRLYEIHDSGPVKYLDMEYVGGGSLADIKFQAPGKRLSEKEVRSIGLQVAAGLAYAHSQGVIHKDIKPQNILVSDDGTAKVMDFGISETVRTSLSRLSNTTSSGTLVYMSPEQVRGRDVGREADIYSFGAMLYELLAGHPPFYKGAIEHQVLNESPEPIEGVSDRMNAFLLKCLAKDYHDRFRSFEEVVAALKKGKAELSGEAAGGSSLSSSGKALPGKHVPAEGPASAFAKKPDTNRLVFKFILLVLLAMLAVVYVQETRERERQARAAAARAERARQEAAKKEQARPFTNSLGMTFVYIKPGTFMMGSPSSESGRDDDERQHQVTLTRGFYMQTTEVTQGQWKAVMGNNPSYFKNCGDDCPVENVSWNDVQEFIRKLNKKTGKNYRLPTEAQWEYACRAGSAGPFNTGGCLSTSQANYHGRYPLSGCSKGQYRGKPVPVASFAPNAWGLYDMHGNVGEWCQDRYGDYPFFSLPDPKRPSYSALKVDRGGSWNSSAQDCRSANRDSAFSPLRYASIGFRLVLLPGQ